MTRTGQSAPREDGCFSLDTILSGQGFSLIEFMLSSLILLVVAGSLYDVLSQTQRTAGYQVEIQGVLEGTRYSMMTIERVLQQAGNDPLAVGFPGISDMNATHVRVRADLTGRVCTGEPPDPDKGDPDGDTLDSGEDVIINYDGPARTLQVGGQPIASNISAFSLQYFDKNGAAALSGDQVTRVHIILTAQSAFPDPRTRKTFSLQLASDIHLLRSAK